MGRSPLRGRSRPAAARPAPRPGPAPQSGPVLEVRALDVRYGASLALQGVELTLERGALSVVGRNGMGKSTLCNAIMGLLPVTGGEITALGQSIVGMSPAAISGIGIGYVPQGRRLWPSLSVDEHLRMTAGRAGGSSIVPVHVPCMIAPCRGPAGSRSSRASRSGSSSGRSWKFPDSDSNPDPDRRMDGCSPGAS